MDANASTSSSVKDPVEEWTAALQAQHKEWGDRLDVLVAKAKQTRKEAEADYRLTLQELRVKHAAAQEKLDEFKVAGGKAWTTLKNGVDGAWLELDGAFQEVAHH